MKMLTPEMVIKQLGLNGSSSATSCVNRDGGTQIELLRQEENRRNVGAIQSFINFLNSCGFTGLKYDKSRWL